VFVSTVKKYENKTLLSGREFANINAPSPKKLLFDISAKHYYSIH